MVKVIQNKRPSYLQNRSINFKVFILFAFPTTAFESCIPLRPDKANARTCFYSKILAFQWQVVMSRLDSLECLRNVKNPSVGNTLNVSPRK